MTREAARLTPRALSSVTHRELRALLRALDAGWLSFPCSELSLGQAGLDRRHCEDVCKLLEPCGAAAARCVLEVAIAERVHRPPPRLELVWTGPEAHESVARDTRIVVGRMFERATASVIIGGFRFDQGASLFRPLHDGLLRGLRVTMFVDIEGHADTPEGGPAFARRSIDALLHENWPFGPPYPDVYYDPRSAVAGPPWVSMHAKCIVVDDEYAFITSANFTERGQTRNLEVGVSIEDREFSTLLAAQWRSLVTRGLVEKYA